MSEADPTVGELLLRGQELDQLYSSAPPATQAYIDRTAGQDPYFGPALEARSLLTRLASDLCVAATIKQDEPHPEKEEITEPSTDIELLLAEIEDDGSQAKQAEQRKQDIESTHGILDSYDKRLRSMGKKPPKKDQENLGRSLRKQINERFVIADIANEPGRLKTVVDSVLSKEAASPKAKTDFMDYLRKQIVDYVESSAPEVTPEIIGERIVTCAEEGIAQSELEAMLLNPYFGSVRGSGSKEVLDNYERFVRGILRIAVNHPQACSYALNIVTFKNKLLPIESRYAVMAYIVPQSRLDNPALWAQRSAIVKSLKLIQLYSLPDSDTVERFVEAIQNIHTDIFDKLRPEVMPKDLVAYSRFMSKLSGFASPVVAEELHALSVLGSDELSQRKGILNFFISLAADPEQHKAHLQSKLAGTNTDFHEDPGQSTDFLVTTTIQRYPGSEAFIRALVESESLVLDELDVFLPNRSNDPRLTFDMMDRAYKEQLSAIIRQGLAPDEIDSLDNLPWEELITQQYKVSISTGDGYVLDFYIPFPAEELTEEDRIALKKLVDPDILVQAKSRIEGQSGVRRRYEGFSLPKYNLTVVLRPENDEDRKTHHPLNNILPKPEELADEDLASSDKMIEYIESLNQLFKHEQRRFMNERGIAVIMHDEEGEAKDALLSLRKHPKNPQAYIGTIQAHGQRVSFLVDSAFRIQLGNKKVDSDKALLLLNENVAEILYYFLCAEAVESTEGVIQEGKSTIASRIAHLRLLPEGHGYSYEAWSNCLEAEGFDLETLSALQARKKGTNRKSTYVKAVEKDDPAKGPIIIKIPDSF